MVIAFTFPEGVLAIAVLAWIEHGDAEWHPIPAAG